tara:strand:+ start:23358 stop:23960 length:603 start_codon:yes stop_codon:yes gene_type:complete
MQNLKYKIIGLTGGIGSGKTFVANIFKRLGIPVFNADYEAKKIMHQSLDLKNKIKRAFGDEIYKDNQLQKKILSKLIFNNEKKLSLLNSLVHPFVFKRFNQWCLNSKSPILLKESAILFESYSNRKCDKVICVVASKFIRIDRVMKRDSVDKNHVQSIISSQISQQEKVKKSDYLIYNNESELILPQIIGIINHIKSTIS